MLGVKLVAFDHNQSLFLGGEEGGGGEFFRLGHKIVVFTLFNSLFSIITFNLKVKIMSVCFRMSPRDSSV